MNGTMCKTVVAASSSGPELYALSVVSASVVEARVARNALGLCAPPARRAHTATTRRPSRMSSTADTSSRAASISTTPCTC